MQNPPLSIETLENAQEFIKTKRFIPYNGVKYPLTQHNIEIFVKYTMSKDEKILKKLSEITLDI